MDSKSDFCGTMARAKAYKLDRLVGIFVSLLPCCKALGKSLSFSAGQVLPFEKGSGDVCLVRLLEDERQDAESAHYGAFHVITLN